MKKTTLLTFILCALVVSSSFAQFPESFEEAVPPTGWATFRGLDDAGVDYDWERTDADANTGDYSAFVRYSDFVLAEDWLVTPEFTPTSATNILEFFQHQSYGADYGNVYEILVSTSSQTDIETFVVVDTQTEVDVPFSFAPYYVDLSAYNDTAIYLAFKMTNDFGDNWYIDDVNLIGDVEAPECAINPTPADDAVDVLIPDGEITLSWDPSNSGDAPTAYEVSFGLDQSLDLFTTTVGTNSIDLINLDLGTEYFWRVIPSNAGGAATGPCPIWSFTTENPPEPSTNTSCAEAQTIECGETLEGNSAGSDGTYEDIGCGLGVNGLWYTFTGTGLNVTVTSTASFDHEMGIAVGQCGALVNEACIDASLGAESYTFETVENETYYVYIAHYFTDDETTGVIGITVECAEPVDPIVPDFVSDFSAFPGGWFEADGPFGFPDGSSSSWQSDDFGNDPGHPNGLAAKVNIFGTTTDEYLISPVFDLSGGTYFLNFDIALVDWNTTNATVLGPDDYVALLVTQDDGVNWAELRRWDENSSIGATREAAEEIELSSYGSEVQFAFYAFSDTSNADTDFFMDNFSLTSNSLSNDEFNQLDIAYYPNPTDGKVYFQTSDIVSKIIVYNMLGQIISETEPNQINPELDLSKVENGAYFVQINQGEMNRTIRIIKN
ncbi:T9SS-dependent choice-of-anchor J family protein [Winogradskyella aurantiaca]|uniref:T9SS-dependent choice-of-anchor J family protein n=1 Tax=Winogradskyella aurantiaca TaxID=2219558 RepID=UPI000E1E1052|nr:choice-of-anchor J domain-containing protein [Winogradskyella aurantiaca]